MKNGFKLYNKTLAYLVSTSLVSKQKSSVKLKMSPNCNFEYEFIYF